MKRKIFFDGRIIAAEEKLISALSPGSLRGKGVFETMRIYQKKIFALDDHLIRLDQGLKLLGIKKPYPEKQLRAWISILLKQNRLREARLRLTIWRDNHASHASMVVLPYRAYSKERRQQGFNAMISDVRLDESKRSPSIKSIDYLPFLTAYEQAEAVGADEALLLNRRGDLAEGSRSNIFFVKKGTLMTPALACGCLKGVTRTIVIKIAREMGINVKTLRAKPQALFMAQEAFLTNSLIEIMPLTWIDGKKIGTGRSGELTLAILKWYRSMVKKDIA